MDIHGEIIMINQTRSQEGQAIVVIIKTQQNEHAYNGRVNNSTSQNRRHGVMDSGN